MATCLKRLSKAVDLRNKAEAAWQSAQATYRYATDENGGWATDREARRLRVRVAQTHRKFDRAQRKFMRLAKSCRA